MTGVKKGSDPILAWFWIILLIFKTGCGEGAEVKFEMSGRLGFAQDKQ